MCKFYLYKNRRKNNQFKSANIGLLYYFYKISIFLKFLQRQMAAKAQAPKKPNYIYLNLISLKTILTEFLLLRSTNVRYIFKLN
jgi:hypothetical protein